MSGRAARAGTAVLVPLTAAWVLAAALTAAPAGEGATRALEELVQDLRPLEERFAREDVASLDPAEIQSIFHELWVKTRRASRLAGEKPLAKDFDELATHAWKAVRAAEQVDPEYYRRPGWPRGNAAVKERLERTKRAAVAATQHADRAVAALERILRRFPLYRDDLEWGARPK